MTGGNQTGGPRPDRNGVRAAGRLPLLALIAAVILASSVTSVDRIAQAEYDEVFRRALVTFALARTLNGVISAVQGTELALQPAGVGVTLTPGEVLDPVNDLIERFSWIMLGATISLGVQHVLLEVGQWWGTRLLLAALGLLWLWIRLRREAHSGAAPAGGFERVLLRTFIVLIFLRFAVPAAMIANEGLYRVFLEDRYVESTQAIESAGSDIEQAMPRAEAAEEAGEGETLFESIDRALESTRQSMDFGRRLDAITERAAELIEHLIQLSVVFILQTGLLPIAFLWIFLQILRRMVQPIN
jgi:hypothetical protein